MMEITEEEQAAYSARERELKAEGIGTGVRVYCSPACREIELECSTCPRGPSTRLQGPRKWVTCSG